MGLALSRYRAAVDALFARTAGGVKPGLERTAALLDADGDPHRKLRVFHVAGTNGKGSVCATLDSLLRMRGFHVGRYTSPHLVDFRERIVVDGRPIGEDEVADWLTDHDPLIERVGATFFEATTALAFDHFARANVDVAVVETGLGGRLDSTNVVQPVAAVVTSIGLDHTDLLGTTLEQIAAEKAGIFKCGSVAMIGERAPRTSAQLLAIARERGASSTGVVGDDWTVSEVEVRDGATEFALSDDAGDQHLVTPLLGEHQAYNAALAIETLRRAGAGWTPTAPEIQRGLQNVRLPGRFQRMGRLIFDVAHNPAGGAVLAKTLGQLEIARPLTTILAVLADKDWRGMMDALAATTDRFILTVAPTAPAGRIWDLAAALEYARAKRYVAEADRDFARVVDRARHASGTTLVTGSFHTVGDAMACLQVDPLAG